MIRPESPHLIAQSSPERLSALRDVRVTFGANADASVVWPRTLDVIKDGLRAAGQATGTITSTIRNANQQADVMLANLTDPSDSIADNVAEQYGVYGAAGDAVIDVFVQSTLGLTREQILDNRNGIWLDMRNEINRQEPERVSPHAGDPTVRNVVDIATGAFTTTSVPLFINAVTPRVTKFLDERQQNRCFHLELL